MSLGCGAKSIIELQYIGIREMIIATLEDCWQYVVHESTVAALVAAYLPTGWPDYLGAYLAKLPIVSRRTLTRTTSRIDGLPAMQMRSVEILCHPAEDDHNQFPSRTRAILPSAMVERNLCFEKTGDPILDLIFNLAGRKRNSLMPSSYLDCEMWKHQTLFRRLAPYGALADKFAGEAADDEDGAGIFNKRRFITGSVLKIEVQTRIARFENRKPFAIRANTRINLLMVGEPFVITSNQNTDPDGYGQDGMEHLVEHFITGEIAWEVTIRQQQPNGTHGPMTGLSGVDSHPAAFSDEQRYCCFFVFPHLAKIPDIDDRIIEKRVKLVTILRPADENKVVVDGTAVTGVKHTTVLSNPETWVRGSMRPCSGVAPAERLQPKINAHGIVTVYMPLVIYTDCFDVAKDSKRKADGFYVSHPTMLESHRTGAQSVRIICVCSGGISSDVVLEAVMEDIQQMTEEGKIMHTSRGPLLSSSALKAWILTTCSQARPVVTQATTAPRHALLVVPDAAHRTPLRTISFLSHPLTFASPGQSNAVPAFVSSFRALM